MNLRQFNRIGHLFNGGLEEGQKKAGHWVDEATGRATKAAHRVRSQVDSGTRNIVSVEEALVRHVRDNPALYAIGVSLLLGALIAKLVLESRRDRQIPLL